MGSQGNPINKQSGASLLDMFLKLEDKQALDKVTTDITELERKKAAIQTEIDQLKERQATYQADLQKVEKEIEEASLQKASLEEKLRDSRQTLSSDVQGQHAALETCQKSIGQIAAIYNNVKNQYGDNPQDETLKELLRILRIFNSVGLKEGDKYWGQLSGILDHHSGLHGLESTINSLLQTVLQNIGSQLEKDQARYKEIETELKEDTALASQMVETPKDTSKKWIGHLQVGMGRVKQVFRKKPMSEEEKSKLQNELAELSNKIKNDKANELSMIEELGKLQTIVSGYVKSLKILSRAPGFGLDNPSFLQELESQFKASKQRVQEAKLQVDQLQEQLKSLDDTKKRLATQQGNHQQSLREIEAGLSKKLEELRTNGSLEVEKKKLKLQLQGKQEKAQQFADKVQGIIIEKCSLLNGISADREQAEQIYKKILLPESELDVEERDLAEQNKEQIIKLIHDYAARLASDLKTTSNPERSSKEQQRQEDAIKKDIITWFKGIELAVGSDNISTHDVVQLAKEKTRAKKDKILGELGEYVSSLKEDKRKIAILKHIAGGALQSGDRVVDYYLGLLRVHRNPLFNRSGIVKVSNGTASFSTLQSRARKILQENRPLTDDEMKKIFEPRKPRWWERADKKEQDKSLSQTEDKEEPKVQSVSNRGG